MLNIFKNNQLLKNITSLGSATMINAALALILGIITRNILGPEQYGYWLTLSIVFTLIPLFQLGTLNAMNREVPYYLARKEYDKVNQIRSSVFTFLFTIPLAIVFTLLFISVFWGSSKYEYKVGLPLVAIIIALSFLSSYIEMYYKSQQNFTTTSKLISIKSISQTILTLFLVYIYGYIGLYFGMILSLLLQLYIGKKAFPKYKRLHSSVQYKELIKIGFPIMLVGIIAGILVTIDRILISIFMTPKDMGDYGVGVMVFSTMMLLPQVVNQVIYPKIVEMVSMREYKQINHFYWKVNKILAIIMAIVVFLLYIFLPYFVEIFMPQYSGGIKAAQILSIGLYPLTLLGVAATYFNSTNNQSVYMAIQVLTIVFNIIFSIILLNLDKTIESVAVATSISFLMYSVIMNFVFFIKFKEHRLKADVI